MKKRILSLTLVFLLCLALLPCVAFAADADEEFENEDSSFRVSFMEYGPDPDAPIFVDGVEYGEAPIAFPGEDYSITLTAGGDKVVVVYDIYEGWRPGSGVGIVPPGISDWTFRNGVLTIGGDEVSDDIWVRLSPAVAVVFDANGGVVEKEGWDGCVEVGHYESFTEDTYTRYFPPDETASYWRDTLLSRKGYALVGYNTDANGEGVTYSTEFIPYAELESGTVLYAMWEPIPDEYIGVWVGDVVLYSGYYVDIEGNLTTAEPQGGYAHFVYDEDTSHGILTLSDFTYTAQGYREGSTTYLASAIDTAGFNNDITVNLQGENALLCPEYARAMYLHGNTVAITGSGSLTIQGNPDSDGDYPAIECTGNVSAIVDTTIYVEGMYTGITGIDRIEGSTVVVKDCYNGIPGSGYADSTYNFGATGNTDLSIVDSTVTVENCYYGISYLIEDYVTNYGSLHFDDSLVTVDAVYPAIVTVDMEVNGGDISGYATDYYWLSGVYSAVYARSIDVSGGSLTGIGCGDTLYGVQADELFVSGGSVRGESAYESGGAGIYVALLMDVSGGSVEGVSGSYGIAAGPSLPWGDYTLAAINISGGEVIADSNNEQYSAASFYIMGDLNLTGGTVYSPGIMATGANIYDGTMNIEGILAAGGGFTLNDTTYVLGYLNISGGELNFTGGLYGSGIYSGTEANISGGKINISTTEVDTGLYSVVGGGIAAARLSISGGDIVISKPDSDGEPNTITTGIAGMDVEITGGSIDITGGTISAFTTVYEFDEDGDYIVDENGSVLYSIIPGEIVFGGDVEILLPGQQLGESVYTEGYEDPETGISTSVDYNYLGVVYADGSVPDRILVRVRNTFSVTFNGKKISSNGRKTTAELKAYTAKLEASRGYDLPESITVTVDGELIEGYTWDSTNGDLAIPAELVTGDIVITAEGKSSGLPQPPGGIVPPPGPGPDPDPVEPTILINGLNTVDHVSYIVGIGDGLFNPLGDITRAEAATIFFRLMTEDFRDRYWSDTCSFADVSATSWYNVAVATLENAGIIKDTAFGGKFRPNDPITRAELAVMAAQFGTSTGTIPVSSFADVPADHWAAKEIALVEFAGWVEGYNGLYRPEDNLSRAEFVTVVNRMLERGAEEWNMLDGMVTFTDNANPNAWYYEAIQEAANSHTYYRTDAILDGEKFRGEKWLELLVNPDWAALEDE